METSPTPCCELCGDEIWHIIWQHRDSAGPPEDADINQTLCRPIQDEEEAVVIIQQDPHLEEALQQSRRVGDLLLKNEDHETAEISRLAIYLLKREYRWTPPA